MTFPQKHLFYDRKSENHIPSADEAENIEQSQIYRLKIIKKCCQIRIFGIIILSISTSYSGRFTVFENAIFLQFLSEFPTNGLQR